MRGRACIGSRITSASAWNGKAFSFAPFVHRYLVYEPGVLGTPLIPVEKVR